MFEAPKYYLETRFRHPLEKPEVENALDKQIWRTKQEILEVINQQRSEKQLPQFDDEKYPNLLIFVGEIKNALHRVLRRMEAEGEVDIRIDREVGFFEQDIDLALKNINHQGNHEGTGENVYRLTEKKAEISEQDFLSKY